MAGVGLGLLLGLDPAALAPAQGEGPASTAFESALKAAEQALAEGKKDEARAQILRALERDARSVEAWELDARWAEAVPDEDERVYALYRALELAIAQKAPPERVKALRARVDAADPHAKKLLDLRTTFLEKLAGVAKDYERAKRPHSAIRVWQEVLALDADNAVAAEAVQRISSTPDPSLAETARPKDLLADVSAEWIRKHDAKHATWEERAKLERPNYWTHTDAGYAVLVRAAEAMEQMNGFYRQFFRYGTEEDGRQVPRIELRIFKDRDEYLKLGSSPPEWSGGQFTGGAVEVYVSGGFEGMVGTMFHEAAHQFIGLATNAAGWLNEGLACFFEGCRIQANGTVLMNLPASGRLFSLAERMAKGWMSDAKDGMDLADPSKSNPPKAPTFRIVLENEYEWGPAWYAPTWGVVYFLYNLQDPADGRFIYRQALHTFVDTSGGRIGKGAIKNFEEVVLAAPTPPTKGVAEAKANNVRLAKTVDELDPVWKDWILALRDEQSGRTQVERPYLAWARHAITRKDHADATEHFEKGLVATPHDVDLLTEFAEHLAGRFKNTDRAGKLVLRALQILEARKPVDEARLAALDKRLEKWDPKHLSLKAVHAQLYTQARQAVERYLSAQRYLLAMHVARRLTAGLRVPGLGELYEQAARRSGRSLALWQLAYNEVDLAGWAEDDAKVFEPYGSLLRGRFGTYTPGRYDYYALSLDQVTSGDFSLEAEVLTEKGKNAFAGLVFGRKSATSFHALVLFPEGFADLVSFYDLGVYKTWRHEALPPDADPWRTLRLDVSGRMVDVWCDGALVTSQELSSLDVLRGRFGLLMGPGEAQFRNVRYLARDPGDPSAAIERAVKLEKHAAGGPATSGSYVGHVPPWPTVAQWMQGPRAGWAEKGPVPTLCVLWSVPQNEILPLQAWLAHLVKQHADVGLEVVAICESASPEKVTAHLAKFPFPGCVGLDHLNPSAGGYGCTMDAYFVGKRFSFPRVLLLDVDQRVVWEGNPGFDIGKPWVTGVPSYLDTPLEELLTRRDLKRTLPWRKDWTTAGASARARGDLAALLPLLVRALPLAAESLPEIGEAHDLTAALLAATSEAEATAKALAQAQAEPAIGHLPGTARALGKPLDAKHTKSLAKHATSPHAKAWGTAVAAAATALKALEDGAEAAATLEALRTQLAALSGALPARLSERLSAAQAAADPAALRQALADAPHLPGLVLLEHVGR
jgi:hypothetical protein